RFRLMLYERATGKITELTKGFDRWVGSFTWANDSKDLYFTTEDKGESPIYRIAINGATEPYKIWAGHDDDLAYAAGDRLFFTSMSISTPNEIGVVRLHELVKDLNGVSHQARGVSPTLTTINADVLDGISRADLEPFWFPGANQTKVEGFIIKPPN